jgi:ubiquinone/menaquinone biosynthesis C-methylase UbiE
MRTLREDQLTAEGQVALSEQLKSNYADYYAEGDSEWRRLGALDKVQNIVDLCGDLPHRRVLEIGAGEGSILQRLSELCFAEQLYALEISPSGVETIHRKRIPHLVECNVFDGYHLPYEAEAFDVAILSHVIEHAEHPRQLLYEASRVAKYVFVEVPLEDTRRLPNDYVPDRVGHINFYSPKTIRRLLQSSNLRVLHQVTTNPSRATYVYQKGTRGLVDYYVKRVLIASLPDLATTFFVYHGAFVCEKK